MVKCRFGWGGGYEGYVGSGTCGALGTEGRCGALSSGTEEGGPMGDCSCECI